MAEPAAFVTSEQQTDRAYWFTCPRGDVGVQKLHPQQNSTNYFTSTEINSMRNSLVHVLF